MDDLTPGHAEGATLVVSSLHQRIIRSSGGSDKSAASSKLGRGFVGSIVTPTLAVGGLAINVPMADNHGGSDFKHGACDR